MYWYQVSALIRKNWNETKHFDFGSLMKQLLLVLFNVFQYLCSSYFSNSLQVWLFSAFFLACICLAFMDDIISRIMHDKRSRMHEHLRMLGVSETSYALAYLLYYAIEIMISISPMLLFSLAFSNKKAFFLTCIAAACLFLAIVIAYAYCAFWDDPEITRLLAALFWFLPAAPALVSSMALMNGLEGTARPEFWISLASNIQYLHPSALFAYHLLDLIERDMHDYSPSQFGDLPFVMLSFAFLLQLVVYLTLGIYFHQLLGLKDRAAPLWERVRSRNQLYPAPSPKSEVASANHSCFEPLDKNRPVRIVLDDLGKEFSEGAIQAVQRVSLSIYEGEVLIFLGPNGAGKTTILECIAGLQAPSRGRVLFHGQDAASQAPKGSVAFCSQADVLHEKLSPLEILQHFGRLRGESGQVALGNALTFLDGLRLQDEAHSKTANLSRAHQRKLSVGLAFAGGCQTIILDDPTSGVDPQSSMEIRSFIREFRQGRTVVISTHSMEEAEALGDRIGIVALGSLQCLGSPSFLKAQIGSGFLLSCTFSADTPCIEPSRLHSWVTESIPNSKLLHSTDDNQQCIQLPSQDVRSLAQLLARIEKHKSELGVQDYQLEPVRLKHVFLNVVQEHELQSQLSTGGLKRPPPFVSHTVSVGTHVRSLVVLIWNLILSDYCYHSLLGAALLFSLISLYSEANFFPISVVICSCLVATRAGCVMQHIFQSDIRLLLDLFGLRPFVYWTVVIACDLLQTALPFVLVLGLWSCCSGHDVPDFCSLTAVLGYIYSMVGFMMLVRLSFLPKSCWKPVLVPLILAAFFVAFSLRAPAALYIAKALQISPLVLFSLRMIASQSISGIGLAVTNGVVGTVFLALAIFIDCCRLYPNSTARWTTSVDLIPADQNVDDDVQAEADRLRSQPRDLVEVVNLYARSGAVRGVHMGVPAGQSLALLGIGGSGKSSVLRSLLGISSAAHGEVYVNGVSVNDNGFGARQHLAYVPQHDNFLIGRMIGRQHLNLVAGLIGVPKKIQSELIDTMLFNIGLTEAVADRRIRTYSGGMKRRLCIAQALLTNRKVVVLDEPSSGVDPACRRRLWSMFAGIQADPERCLMLSTNRLDEAEAVCDRIGILVQGRIICLGSATHLKRKLGKHYQIDLVAGSVGDLGAVRVWFQRRYPRAILAESRGDRLRFWLQKPDAGSFAELFAFVYDPLQDQVVVRQGRIVGATLEQIFLCLAHEAKLAPGAFCISMQSPAGDSVQSPADAK